MSLSAGIRPKEIDFSFYVKQLSTSACGMMGIAERGGVNDPTLCTSWEQFVKKFGSYIAGSYLAYAARQFFDNGGSILWVNRIGKDAVSSFASIVDRGVDAAAKQTLKVSFKEPGTYANGRYSVVIADNTDNTKFDLTIKEGTVTVEAYTALTMATVEDLTEDSIFNFEDLASSNTGAVKNPKVGTYALAGGTNGDTGITSTEYIGDSATKTGLYAFDAVKPLNLLCAPGVALGDFVLSALTYCETRKYTFFIGEIPRGVDVETAKDYRRGTGDYEGLHTAFNSSYGALYGPWLGVTDPLTSKTKLIPPSGHIAGMFARSDKTAVWAAPAGTQRGRLFNVVSVETGFSEPDMDVLYPEGINPIAKFTEDGVVVWGQRTLQSQSSATDRINVRRLMMYLEEAISGSGRFTVFEPNNPATWRALERLVVPFLRKVKDGGGLYDFAFQCDEETNPPEVQDLNEMVARIFVKPTKTAEFVELQFVLTATGATFKEIF